MKKLKKKISALPELENHESGLVSHINTTNRNALQKILAIGILPNTEINLIQKFPSYVLQIGKSQFAVDEELAAMIYVRRV